MKCSFPECQTNAIKVCSFHHYAICQIHLNKHKEICNEILSNVDLYQSILHSSRNVLNSAYKSSKSNLLKFSHQLIKKVEELTDSKLKDLKSAFDKEDLNELKLGFRNEELKYLSFNIEYIFKFKQFEAQLRSSDKIETLEGKTLKGLFDSNLSGFGEIHYQNGTKYLGGLINGVESGLGFNSSVSGSRYFGEYLSGVRSGSGVYVFNEFQDLSFVGFFANGEKNGFGVLNLSNYCYEGNFENGVFKGFGEIRYHNQSSYKGEFLNDKITGYGKFIFSNGDTYIGYLNNGLMHGQGKRMCSSGEIFEGEWFENKKHGKGKLIKSNGEVVEGTWALDKFSS